MSADSDGRSVVPAWWRPGCAVVAALCLLPWLKGLHGEASSESYSGWSLSIEITSSSSGTARLYYAAETGGISEEASIDRPITGGSAPQLLRFALPRNDLMELRIDPIDVDSQFSLGDPVISGPRHRPFEESEQDVTLRRDRAINAIEQADGSFVSQGPDPHFYLKIKDRPLSPPLEDFSSYAKAGWIPAGFGAVLGGFLWWWLASGRSLGPLRMRGERLAQCLAQCSLVFGLWGVTLFFIWPERKLDASTLYAFSLAPLMIAALLAWLTITKPYEAWAKLKTALRPDNLRCCLRAEYSALLCCGALLGMLLLHLLFGLNQSTVPRLSTVLGSLATFVAIALAGGLWWRFRSALNRLMTMWMSGFVALVAVLTLWRMNEFYAPEWQFYKRFPDTCFFPLHRSISGSSACAVILISWLVLAVSRFRPVGLAFAVVGAVPLWLWLLLAQSRGVLLAATGTLVLIAWLIPGRRGLSVACLFLLSGVVVYFTPLSDVVSRKFSAQPALSSAYSPDGEFLMEYAPMVVAMLASSATVTADPATPIVAPVPAAPTALAVSLKRTDQVRRQIWQTYVNESLKRPVFGHGFGGKHKLLVQGKAETGLEQRLLKVSWNPHNVHISYLYFCGIVGVLIEGGLLLLIWWRGAFDYWRKKHNSIAALVFGLLAAYAGVSLVFESTLMAYEKDAVLLHLPNEYWLIYWVPVLLGSVWVTFRSGSRTADAGTA